MLQKLENAYLAILRMVVIIASGILLIGFVLFSASAMRGLGDSPSEKIDTPVVDSGSVIEAATAAPAEGAEPRSTVVSDEQAALDAKKPYFDKLVKLISGFVTKQSGGEQSVDEDALRGILADRASNYDDRDFSADYLKGLSATIDKAFADKKIVTLATNERVFEVIDVLIRTYTEKFDEKIAAENARVAKEQEEHEQAKVESTLNLYFAGGSFALFLLIVFLSIFIKIERNLRRG